MSGDTDTHKALLDKINDLELAVAALKERLRAADPLSGGVVEFYIAELIGGRLTMGLAAYDIVTSNGTFFEVKFSRLGIPHKASKSRRWSWGIHLGKGCQDFRPLDFGWRGR